MGFFDRFRRKPEAGLFENTSAGFTVTNTSADIVDASTDPELYAKVMDALRAAGIDPSTSGTSVELHGEEAAQMMQAMFGQPDLADELTKLAELHSSGALTDAEFAAAKAKLLGGGP